MTKLYALILKEITRKIVIQGFSHREDIIRYFEFLIEAARREFTEDNEPTLNDFLEECFKEALLKNRNI